MPAQEEVPKWISIKKLDRENSEKFQKVAGEMATELAIPRGRLDVTLWSEGPEQPRLT
jgi:hypothetical protein